MKPALLKLSLVQDNTEFIIEGEFNQYVYNMTELYNIMKITPIQKNMYQNKTLS